MAIKTSAGVAYFQDALPVRYMFSEDGLLPKKAFLGLWASLPAEDEKNAVCWVTDFWLG